MRAYEASQTRGQNDENASGHFAATCRKRSYVGLSACGEVPRGPPVPRAEATRATVLGIPNERFHPIVDVKLAQDELLQAAERRRRTYGVATPFDMPQYNMLAVSGGGDMALLVPAFSWME